jgi:hypothetical protein
MEERFDRFKFSAEGQLPGADFKISRGRLIRPRRHARAEIDDLPVRSALTAPAWCRYILHASPEARSRRLP